MSTGAVRNGAVLGWSILVVGAAILASILAIGNETNWLILGAVPMVIVGGLLVVKVPDNAVGVVLLLGGSAWLVYVTANSYARFSLASPDAPWPGEHLAAWLGAWTGALLPLSLAALLIVFPDGKASGWRRGLLVGTLALAGSALLGAVLLWKVPTVDLTVYERLDGYVAYGFVDVAFLFGFLAVIPATLSLLLRYRSGSVVERQQIKWLLAASAAFALVFMVGTVFFEGEDHWVAVASVTMALIPVAIAIAITRYHLYDIDRLINRTVVYAVVVGLLGAVFVAGAVWLPSLLPFEDNSLAVASSTLAVFFLFNPLRRRVQRFVDRRFYRSRYDAQRVADEFSTRLRDQVDPEAVAGEWVEVVQRTLQPEAVAVWVRDEA